MTGIPADHAVKFASIDFDVRPPLPGGTVYLCLQRGTKVVVWWHYQLSLPLLQPDLLAGVAAKAQFIKMYDEHHDRIS